MLRRVTFAALITVLGLGLGACESRTDKTDGGGVLLSVSDFDGLPVQVGVNNAVAAGGLVQIEEITIQNIAKDPFGSTSQLMNVEMDSYEVTFTRADGGSRVPPSLVRDIFGVAPVNGTETYENLPVMSLEQLDTEPLSDLQFINGGFDRETGDQTILLNFRLRFFGRTLSGDAVQTEPIGFTIEFVP
ncbi:MAG: hypothetical protein DWQ36_00170 [Acidobacteria bacterium]|nr:MAG: hypothetical protein DWQ30_05785 [Acidobacteriota bacterium]REK12119.1 MAG: hypothetical protein DWQ36_00170 [Acidobacteriota bacterium]